MNRALGAVSAVVTALVCRPAPAAGHGAAHAVRASTPAVVTHDEPRRRSVEHTTRALPAHAGKHVKLRPIRPVPLHASWRPYRHEPWRRGYVSLFGHGKRWSGYLVGPAGEVLPHAQKALSDVLASWRTGKELLIDERLVSLIADVSDEFGGRPIRIVSGYREFSYAPDSKHKVGQAFDFSVPGVPNDRLRDFLRSLPDVGVGYYPNSTHVHLDVRNKSTYWVDYSRPGEHPLYAYERRVGGLTPSEQALARALDALGPRSNGTRAVTVTGGEAEARAPVPLHAGSASGAPIVPARSVVAAGSAAPPSAAFPLDEAATSSVRRAIVGAEDAGEDEVEPAPSDAGTAAPLVTR